MPLDLENIFKYHPPVNERQQEAYENNRKTLLRACLDCMNNTPSCAEQTIAIRKMQEAMFYFNAAVALNPEKYK